MDISFLSDGDVDVDSTADLPVQIDWLGLRVGCQLALSLNSIIT